MGKKTVPQEFVIRELREDDLPALAVHWRESIRGWPPGFTIPIPDWSPSSVREYFLRTNYIACWVGWLGDVIVGYLKYCKYWQDEEATMVDLFNVHPDYHGKGYGRKLLVTAVDRGIQDKVKRIDLYTWSANTKAVPLYKKCGFFWRPWDSDVHMYNFLPAVINCPIVREFLGDEHWYNHLRQPLEIKEDDEEIEGCLYHRYFFEKDNKKLEVWVDPSTAGLTGIISQELTIKCLIPGRSHVAGFPHPVKWFFAAPKDKPRHIKIT